MQLAHPKIAAGVAQASQFQADPIGRLVRTMTTMWSIIFDEREAADASLRRMQGRHHQVRGAVGKGERLPKGTGFDALDPELLLWVHATLIDSALVTYEHFVGPLNRCERVQYYDETRRLAAAFGIADGDIPWTIDDFDRYVARMLTDGTVAVGPTARGLARDILHPRLLLLKPTGPVVRLLTAGLLPAELREAYGFSWNRRQERVLGVVGRISRWMLPATPGPLRVAPNARASERRWAARGQPSV